MSVQRHARLNQLLHELPEDYVADTAWLKGLGLSASSIQGYVRQQWLEHLAPGLYRRRNPTMNDRGPVRWEICLLSLQNIMKRPIHVGGQTALEMAGYWQYAMLGKRCVWLYTDDRRARSTLERVPLDAVPKLRRRRLFEDATLGLETRVLDLVTSTLGAAAKPTAAKSSAWKQQLTVSGLERAILEVLSEVPAEVGFDHGAELFEGLTTLRPAVMKELLLSCTSIKTKRLFFYFAGQHRALRKRLRPADFDLGSGKRQIVPGGQYDAEFQITVPRSRRRK